MRSALFLLFISFLGMASCHHSGNTPAPMIDPLAYVDSMAGNHHWHGIWYSYSGNPAEGKTPNDSTVQSLDDTIVVVSSKKLFCFDDSLFYSKGDSAKQTITFTAYSTGSFPNYTADTLVYNYNTRTYLFKRYEFYQVHGGLFIVQSP